MRLGWRSFRKDDGGVAAIEFALLAIPFFLLLFSIMEIALILTASMQLEHAVDRVARRLMTGETINEKAAIRTDLCGEMVFRIDCAAMRIDYREVAAVTDFSLPKPLANRKVVDTAFDFKVISDPSFTSLRVGYEWSLILEPLAVVLSNLSNGSVFLVSTSLVRIEK